MAWLGEKLGIRNPEDWYKTTGKEFASNGGGGLLTEYYQGSPSAAVMEYLPDYNWHREKFSFRKKRQKQLYRIIKRIFIGYEVKWDFKHPQLRFVETQRNMELDIFITELGLAIEYQGEQHAFPVSTWGGISALKSLQKRDEEKREACRRHGIILVEIPHIWNGQEGTAIEMLIEQFVKKANEKIKGVEQIKATLKVIKSYHQKINRKRQGKSTVNKQIDFNFHN